MFWMLIAVKQPKNPAPCRSLHHENNNNHSIWPSIWSSMVFSADIGCSHMINLKYLWPFGFSSIFIISFKNCLQYFFFITKYIQKLYSHHLHLLYQMFFYLYINISIIKKSIFICALLTIYINPAKNHCFK